MSSVSMPRWSIHCQLVSSMILYKHITMVHTLYMSFFYDSLQTHHNGPFTVSWSLLGFSENISQWSIHCQLVSSMILYKHITMVHSLSVGFFYDSLQTHHNGPFTVSWFLLGFSTNTSQWSIHCQLVSSRILYKHITMVHSLSVGFFYDSLQTHHNGPFTVSWFLLGFSTNTSQWFIYCQAHICLFTIDQWVSCGIQLSLKTVI